MLILALSILAIISKLVSGLLIGNVVHGSKRSGIEIWTNTIGRGEFSIALAALYGSPVVSSAIAAMVIITSIVGSFSAKYSGPLQDLFIRGRKGKPEQVPAVSSDRIA